MVKLTTGEKIARDLCEMDATIGNAIEVDPVDVARRIDEAMLELSQQLAAEQLNNKRLRQDQELLVEAWNYGQFADDFNQPQTKQVRAAIRRFCEALSTPISTEALDAYVAEKVKGSEDAYLKAAEAATLLSFKAEELTKQRDLAVEALEAIAGRRIFIDNLASNVDIAVMTIDTIKESEAK